MAIQFIKPMMISLKLTVILGLCALLAMAELQRFEHQPKADGSLTVLVVGDWGRKGSYNQSEVAVQVLALPFNQDMTTKGIIVGLEHFVAQGGYNSTLDSIFSE
ncbi:unnamed protein product [Ilex paraguariensis]|uniref:Uncharacterized protein n=1 Tax=Ilex paraguariensis TaxID=185542 RepID=A0ABC8TZ34_9AQUA